MTPPKWILLAEDNPFDVELSVRALKHDRFLGEIVVAKDGQEAIDCLYRRGKFEMRPVGHPSVVLLDLKMPQPDGLEVLFQIKTDPQLRIVPVVMFTSSREETDVSRGYQLGANAFVVKPVNFQQFMAAIHAIRTFWTDINEPPARSIDSSPTLTANSLSATPSPNLKSAAVIRPSGP